MRWHTELNNHFDGMPAQVNRAKANRTYHLSGKLLLYENNTG